jgi:predicted RNA binding protein YcfA (HicA-like mRNA interferase family)
VANADKLLGRMRDNPRDWRIEDVEAVCAGFGIACTAPRKGSHYKIKHERAVEILTIPAHRPIKPVYIRDLVRLIDLVRGGIL